MLRTREGPWLPVPHAPPRPYSPLQAGDSAGTKLTGALLNALIFVVVVTVLTFVLVLLVKYGVSRAGLAAGGAYLELPRQLTLHTRTHAAAAAAQCTRLVYAYMAFSGFSIFFLLGGIIALQLLQKAGAALDLISFTYMLLNFAVRCVQQAAGRACTRLLGACASDFMAVSCNALTCHHPTLRRLWALRHCLSSQRRC